MDVPPGPWLRGSPALSGLRGSLALVTTGPSLDVPPGSWLRGSLALSGSLALPGLRSSLALVKPRGQSARARYNPSWIRA